MSTHTFIAAARLADGTKLKLRVDDAPDDITVVRAIIADELAQAGTPARCIVIRTDGVRATVRQEVAA